MTTIVSLKYIELSIKSVQRLLTLLTLTHTHTYLWFRQGLFDSVEGLAVVSVPA